MRGSRATGQLWIEKVTLTLSNEEIFKLSLGRDGHWGVSYWADRDALRQHDEAMVKEAILRKI